VRAVSPTPSFPRPVTGFVGRDAELRRLADALVHEPVHLVYGVGGIGKSELVYKAIDEARRHPALEGMPAVLVSATAGMRGEELAALTQVRLGARTGVGSPMPDAARRLDDDLEEIVRALDERPRFLFIDDAHLAEPGAAARLLAHLARHVRHGRVLAASRVELPWPPGAPPPIVTRLGPLDAESSARLWESLAERLGVDAVAGRSARLARAAGSPFYLQRALVDAAGAAAADPLGATIDALTPAERAALVHASSLRGALAPEELAEAIGPGAGDALAALKRRFLVDLDRGIVLVHDLVRDALEARTTPEERREAAAWAAHLLTGRFTTDPAGHVLDGVGAVAQLVAAGDPEGAWGLAQVAYRQIAAAGLDHLLLPVLVELREALPAARLDIDILRARVLVRRSHILEADRVLRQAHPPGGGSVRYLLLVGLAAQHLGEPARAQATYEQALAAASSEGERDAARLALAVLSAWQGDHDRVVALAADAADRPGAPAKQRARWRWTLMLDAVLHMRFEEAAALGRRTLADLDDAPRSDDLRLMVAMVSTLAHAESRDVAGARRIYEAEVAPAVVSGTLRVQLATLYHGIVLQAEGHLREAVTALAPTFASLMAHRDHLHACFAGHYLGQSLLALGDAAGALDVLGRSSDAAEAAGVVTLVPMGRAGQAAALLALGRVDEARARAESALAPGRVVPAPPVRRMAERVLAVVRCGSGAGSGAGAVGPGAPAPAWPGAPGGPGGPEGRGGPSPEAAPGAAGMSPAGSPRERAYADHDLVIELDAGRIVADGGRRAVRGRPIACALLARFIADQGQILSAETLYCDVWGGLDYHPLRHRNTVYVGVNRLRSTLRELLPDRELIETVPHARGSGWRLVSEVRACVLTLAGNPEK
jgi:DNA-binding response OmpR family regulator/tetratricopeptide (TPR) repeat protein